MKITVSELMFQVYYRHHASYAASRLPSFAVLGNKILISQAWILGLHDLIALTKGIRKDEGRACDSIVSVVTPSCTIKFPVIWPAHINVKYWMKVHFTIANSWTHIQIILWNATNTLFLVHVGDSAGFTELIFHLFLCSLVLTNLNCKYVAMSLYEIHSCHHEWTSS